LIKRRRGRGRSWGLKKKKKKKKTKMQRRGEDRYKNGGRRKREILLQDASTAEDDKGRPDWAKPTNPRNKGRGRRHLKSRQPEVRHGSPVKEKRFIPTTWNVTRGRPRPREKEKRGPGKDDAVGFLPLRGGGKKENEKNTTQKETNGLATKKT